MPNIAPEPGPASWPADEKTIGVAGVAPFATLDFLRALYSLCEAEKDWHFPRVVADINTKLPSRGRHFDLGERDPSPFIRATIEELRDAGAGVVVVPCNTAHLLYERWVTGYGVTVPNLVDVAAKAVRAAGVGRVLVLGSAAVMQRGLYEAPLARLGVATLPCSAAEVELVSSWIGGVKRHGRLDDAAIAQVEGLVDAAIARGADGVLLACTELGLLSAQARRVGPCIDSNLELARAALALARSGGGG